MWSFPLGGQRFNGLHAAGCGGGPHGPNSGVSEEVCDSQCLIPAPFVERALLVAEVPPAAIPRRSMTNEKDSHRPKILRHTQCNVACNSLSRGCNIGQAAFLRSGAARGGRGGRRGSVLSLGAHSRRRSTVGLPGSGACPARWRRSGRDGRPENVKRSRCVQVRRRRRLWPHRSWRPTTDVNPQRQTHIVVDADHLNLASSTNDRACPAIRSTSTGIHRILVADSTDSVGSRTFRRGPADSDDPKREEQVTVLSDWSPHA